MTKIKETAMATGRLHAFNFQGWIKDNQHLLKPVSYTHLTLPTILRV